MKIKFDDNSSVECKKSDSPDKIWIIIQAKDQSNPLKKIINSIEITKEEFKNLISDIL
jgi:hypothetical protein